MVTPLLPILGVAPPNRKAKLWVEVCQRADWASLQLPAPALDWTDHGLAPHEIPSLLLHCNRKGLGSWHFLSAAFVPSTVSCVPCLCYLIEFPRMLFEVEISRPILQRGRPGLKNLSNWLYIIHQSKPWIKQKRKSIKWEKIFIDDMTDKGLISNIYKHSNNSTSKHQAIGLKNRQKNWIDIFSKEELQMTTHMKRCSTSLTIREKQIKITMSYPFTPVIICCCCSVTKWKLLNRVLFFVTPWTIPWTIQSMEFSRPEYWNR